MMTYGECVSLIVNGKEITGHPLSFEISGDESSITFDDVVTPTKEYTGTFTGYWNGSVGNEDAWAAIARTAGGLIDSNLMMIRDESGPELFIPSGKVDDHALPRVIICPYCGKANLPDALACGAGEWDGCGASLAQVA